jgi:nucleoside phosphorylase
MDSEKYIKLEKQLEHGESPNDEGPFYHHSFWESYKGSIKGKLGGIAIGALIGAVVGGIVVGAMALATSLAPAVLGITFVGITGAGLLYGMNEFSEIGKIVGAQAAVQEQADAREAIRFSALEKKVDALTEAVKGSSGKAIKKVDTSEESEALTTYRKTHYAKLNGSTKGPIFWKVALIGLVVGAAAGAILATGGLFPLAGGASLASTMLAHTIGESLVSYLGAGGIMAASMTIMGMFGASFGINRDYFRRIFDVTDLWSGGMLSSKKVEQHQEEAGKAFEKENGLQHGTKEEVATAIASDGYLDYPVSATFHRDRVIKASAQALQELDHTRATSH